MPVALAPTAVALGRALTAAETVRLASVEVDKGQRQPPVLPLLLLLLVDGWTKIALTVVLSKFHISRRACTIKTGTAVHQSTTMVHLANKAAVCGDRLATDTCFTYRRLLRTKYYYS